MTTTVENILQTGTVLNDKWVILELIGKGGMGEVYRAHQLNLKRDVAIKVISREWLQTLEDDVEEIEKALQRFRREVQAMSQIRHPNVLQIFDYGSDTIKKDGEDSSIEYIVMEYIPGATLRFTMSEEGFYPDQETIKSWLEEHFLPVLNGVQVMHELDMVHREEERSGSIFSPSLEVGGRSLEVRSQRSEGKEHKAGICVRFIPPFPAFLALVLSRRFPNPQFAIRNSQLPRYAPCSMPFAFIYRIGR